jgi:hypothetical protein
MSFQAHVYNHSNDGVTAAIRFHQDIVRQLIQACLGQDQNLPPRTLADYIAEADAATHRPESFFRNVCILWQHPTIHLPTQFCTDRRFRVTYSGNVRPGGGISFEGYCVVDPAWYSTLLPLAPRAIEIEYIPGTGQDVIQVVG